MRINWQTLKKLESKRISKKNSSNAQTSFDYLVRSNKSMEGYRRQANETEREKRNFLFYGEPILPTEIKYGLKFKRFLSELAGIKEDQLPNFSSDRDKVEQSLINSGFSIDQAAAVLDEYETNGLKTVTTDVLESSIDDNNNIPLDRNYYNSMSKKMNDSKGVLNDEEMSDLIKEISSNLMTNLSQVNPTEINISVESKKNGTTESKPAKTDTSSAKETEESDAELFKSSLDEDGINDDFIEASLFDDLSENVAEAEKAFMSGEIDLSLQDNLFNQSEINNAEDRKKKC